MPYTWLIIVIIKEARPSFVTSLYVVFTKQALVSVSRNVALLVQLTKIRKIIDWLNGMFPISGFVCSFSQAIYVDVGTSGKTHDSTTFKKSTFYKGLVDNSLNLPTPEPLPGDLFNSYAILLQQLTFHFVNRNNSLYIFQVRNAPSLLFSWQMPHSQSAKT